MSRSDNNEPSSQQSGTPAAGSQPVTQPTIALRPMNLGIDYSKAPSLETYRENRVRFDFSGYEPNSDGRLQKFTVISVKKKPVQTEAQESSGAAATPPSPRQ